MIGRGAEAVVHGVRTREGRRGILKVRAAEARSPRELEYLTKLAGPALVPLWAADPEGGAILLERLDPGTPLAAVDDDATALQVFVNIAGTLQRPASRAGSVCPDVGAEYGEALARVMREGPSGSAALDSLVTLQPLAVRAAAVLERLVSTLDSVTLLHGDLHDHNILGRGGGWCAIDPKGLWGDRALEPAMYLMNRLARGGRRSRDAKVLEWAYRLADALALDRSRVLQWLFVQSVVCLAWMDEASGGGPAVGEAGGWGALALALAGLTAEAADS